MKRTNSSTLVKIVALALIAALLLPMAGALAEGSPLKFHFKEKEIVNYVGNKMKLTAILNNPSQLKESVTVQLVDQNDLVLAEAKMAPKQKEVNFKLELTQELFGKHLVTVSLNGEKLSDPLYVAVGDKKARILTGIVTDEKVISLTMDFAFGEPDTQAYFDLFDEYGIKISCFFMGRYANDHPDILTMIRDRGHDIGNHSMTHPHNANLTQHERFLQVTKAQEAIRNACGVDAIFYRPPFGEYSQDIKAFAMAEGMTLIMWTNTGNDSVIGITEDQSYNHLVHYLEPGQIILTHNDGIVTLGVLKRFIPYALEQGYRFVPVSELMNMGPWREGTDKLRRMNEK